MLSDQLRVDHIQIFYSTPEIAICATKNKVRVIFHLGRACIETIIRAKIALHSFQRRCIRTHRVPERCSASLPLLGEARRRSDTLLESYSSNLTSLRCFQQAVSPEIRQRCSSGCSHPLSRLRQREVYARERGCHYHLCTGTMGQTK